MKNYRTQITQTCIQTHFNLYGVMPGTQELNEMLGDEEPLVIPVVTIRNDEPAA